MVPVTSLTRHGPRAHLGPAETDRLLRRYGIRTPDQVVVSTVDELEAVAGSWPGPLVLKAVVPGLAHKSDVGGVALELSGQ